MRLLIAVVALLATTDIYALDSLAVQAVKPVISPIVVDTLATDSPSLSVLLFNDGTWRYTLNRTIEQDSTLYSRYWDTENISAYRSVTIDIPILVALHRAMECATAVRIMVLILL